jgi:light-regulated signal transduction histidine kinase (bacteriophytochrome)
MEERGNAVGTINDIQNDLYHIHSMADLLVGKYQEMVDSEVINESDMISSPILSIAEIITEKTEKCLNQLGMIEASMREEMQTSSSAVHMA